MSEYKIAYRIMACRQRAFIVDEMLKKLDGLDVKVFWDDRPEGERKGTYYTQLACINDAIVNIGEFSHICLLQDDLLLVNDFDKCMEKLLERKEDVLWTLYCPRIRDVNFEHPYVQLYPANTWGQGNLFPLQMAIDMLKYRKEVIPNYIYDDGLYWMYLWDHGLPCYTTSVAVLQHLCPSSSMLGYNNGKKVSKVWAGEDIFDKVNWVDQSEKKMNFSPDKKIMEAEKQKYGKR